MPERVVQQDLHLLSRETIGLMQVVGTLRFTGFDSAWGGSKKGAVCDLISAGGSEPLRIEKLQAGVTWDDALRLLVRAEAEHHVIAIDQGLVVPNAKGQRPVERDLAKALMRDFKLGAHSSNTSNACYGRDAGIWRLVAALEAAGYEHYPMAVADQCAGRFYFECYPHPAWIGLFDLPSTLQYKVTKKNKTDWARAVERVRSLATAPLAIENIQAYVPADLAPKKENEDLLDAIVSAYVAAIWWHRGTERAACVGDLETGYIVTPVSEATRLALQRVFGERWNRRGRVHDEEAT